MIDHLMAGLEELVSSSSHNLMRTRYYIYYKNTYVAELEIGDNISYEYTDRQVIL